MKHAFSTLIVALGLAATIAHGQSGPPLSAWDVLMHESPTLIERATPVEREILQFLTPEQVQHYLDGAGPAAIVLSTGERLDEFLARKAAASFDLSWYSIDGGGGTMTGGEFAVIGTIGQHDAGSLGGGDFNLTGGFLSMGLPPPTEDPCLTGDALFCDGFESGDTSMWSSSAN